MKKVILVVMFVFGLSGASFAQSIEGTWRTAVDDNGNSGLIEVTACGSRFCGVLIKSFDSSGAEMASDNVGKQIIWDMKDKGNGAYGNGKIWSPDRDKTYNSKLQVTGDTLTVKGCVLGICRDGGVWTRAN